MANLEVLLPLIVFVPFGAALVALFIGRWTGRATGILMVLAAGSSFGLSLWLFTRGQGGEHTEAVIYHFAWIPDLSINLRFIGDNFGLFFAMLVSGIGTLVGIYSCGYIPKLDPGRVGRYYAALIAFMGAMLGVAVADDLFLLFVFWEITSFTSFLLIGFWYERDEGRKGAMTALQVTALGGLAMMGGFMLVGQIADTFTISALAENEALQQAIRSGAPLAIAALVLIFLGAFTKSAQWPFHFWLPNAMVAPTPVSAYLHAATMVKAGIFLIGRMLPVFSEAAIWSPVLVTFGLITFFLGAYQALRESDLKAILARTTLSTLGLVMMIYGLKASQQDAIQLLNHAVYKGSLFLVAGIVEHATHTRDLRELGGLRKKMPLTFVICVVAALSMAGLPPFFGFVAKESLYAELLSNKFLLASPLVQWMVIGLTVLSNAFIFAVSFKLIFGLFFGKLTDKAKHAHEAGPLLMLPPVVLVCVVIGMGVLATGAFTGYLVNALSSNVNHEVHAAAHLLPDMAHPGPLLLSLATITLGVLLYRGRGVVNRIQDSVDKLPTMQWLWDKLMEGITWVAVAFSSRWQSGSLHWYFSGIMLFFVGLTAMGLYRSGITPADVTIDMSQTPWYGVVLCVLLCAAVMAVVLARTRLAATIAITAVGFLVSLLFVVYRSPDILLTQILIETVSTIFILLILFFMPAFRRDAVTPGRKAWNFAIASSVGIMMFVLVLLASSPSFRETRNLGLEYLSRAYEQAGGQNAVNVIIVDFRAIDTTGEITVLVVVGLCIYGLLRTRRKAA